jgi:hypothetical protein
MNDGTVIPGPIIQTFMASRGVLADTAHNYIVPAVAQAVAAGCTDAMLEFGANDALAPAAAIALLKSNVQAIAALLIANGIVNIFIPYPLQRWLASPVASTETATEALRQYQAYPVAIADGVNIFAGDPADWAFSIDCNDMTIDFVHPSAAGSIGDMYSKYRGYKAMIDPAPSGGGVRQLQLSGGF